MSKYKKNILILIMLLIAIPAAAAYYFLLTERGSKTTAEAVLNRLNISETKSVETIEGTVLRKMVFKNVEFKDLEGLPSGNIVRIQELEISPRSLNKKDMDVKVDNGRVLLPHSEPILINGTYINKHIKATVFSKSVNLVEILQVVQLLTKKQINWARYLSGTATQLDAAVDGTLQDLHITGEVISEKSKYKDIIIMNSPIAVDYNIKDLTEKPQLFGKTTIRQGSLKIKKTAITLNPSEIIFPGDPEFSIFHLNGSSKVETVDINLRLDGTLKKPEITLNSTPPYPQELLLVMLATGKEWKGVVDTSGQQGSPDLSSDFIDYFVGEGNGEKMAQTFGIREIQVELDKNKQGVTFSRDIVNNVAVSYGVDQTQLSPTEKTTSQTLGGKVKVTDAISVGVERELKEKVTPEENTSQLPNDRVLMEYKKKF
jgi:hypothetical protein